MASLPGEVLLRMSEVGKAFGATKALRGVSLEVRAGEVLALIGENGAGKSTLMKILSGALAPDSGTMELAGKRFAPQRPVDSLDQGVAMIYQELTLALDMSVEDNILLGQETSFWGWLDRGEQRRRVADALALLGHPELRPETPVALLSIGARQLVEIARALVRRSRLIVFDEPTSSLPRHDVDHLFEVIRRLRSEGMGIVYISHFLEEVRSLCDRYTVLRDGQSVSSGPLAGVTEEELVALMVGRNVDTLFPVVPHQAGDVVLALDRLRAPTLAASVSLELRRGEILGLAGLMGAGRTELLRAIFSLDPVRSGEVRVAAAAIGPFPAGRIAAGIGMVSEDRKTEGLAQNRSLADNLTYTRLDPYQTWGLLDLPRRDAAAEQWLARLQVKARDAQQEVQALSGGNQQKVAIARLLHQEAEILLLDEPTRGIDVGTKAEIYRLMGELAAAGKAIIFVSSYLPELLAVCDRIGAMCRGKLREIRPAREWTEETLLAAALAGQT